MRPALHAPTHPRPGRCRAFFFFFFQLPPLPPPSETPTPRRSQRGSAAAPTASRGSQARSGRPGLAAARCRSSPGLPPPGWGWPRRRGTARRAAPRGSSAPPGAPRPPPPASRLSLRGGDGCQQITSRPRREREIYKVSPPHVLASPRSDVEGLRGAEGSAGRAAARLFIPLRATGEGLAAAWPPSPPPAEVPQPRVAGSGRGEGSPDSGRKSSSCQTSFILFLRQDLTFLAPIIKVIGPNTTLALEEEAGASWKPLGCVAVRGCGGPG